MHVASIFTNLNPTDNNKWHSAKRIENISSQSELAPPAGPTAVNKHVEETAATCQTTVSTWHSSEGELRSRETPTSYQQKIHTIKLGRFFFLTVSPPFKLTVLFCQSGTAMNAIATASAPTLPIFCRTSNTKKVRWFFF